MSRAKKHMRYGRVLAVASGLILLLSGTLANARAAGLAPDITLELSSLKVFVGDVMTFSGSLLDSDTGEGIMDKTVTIYRDGPIVPTPLVTAVTGQNGLYSVDWIATFERSKSTPMTVFAQFDGEGDIQGTRTGKTTFILDLKPLELTLTTDGNKNRYTLGQQAFVNVAFTDNLANFVDPDFLRATYDGKFVEMNKEDVGRYTFTTPPLVKFEQHQFGVFATMWGHQSAQKELTITAFGVHGYKPMKVSASQRGEDVRITVRNNDLSPSNVYTFVGTLIGGVPMSGSAKNWQFFPGNSADSFTFKAIEGYLPPGKSVVFKLKVDGSPTKLTWKAFDLYGKEHSTVRDIAGSGATTVKTLRPE
jgi:hypothetical protein